MLLGDHNRCRKIISELQILGMTRPQIAKRLCRAAPTLNCLIKENNRFSDDDETILEQMLKENEFGKSTISSNSIKQS